MKPRNLRPRSWLTSATSWAPVTPTAHNCRSGSASIATWNHSRSDRPPGSPAGRAGPLTPARKSAITGFAGIWPAGGQPAKDVQQHVQRAEVGRPGLHDHGGAGDPVRQPPGVTGGGEHVAGAVPQHHRHPGPWPGRIPTASRKRERRRSSRSQTPVGPPRRSRSAWTGCHDRPRPAGRSRGVRSGAWRSGWPGWPRRRGRGRSGPDVGVGHAVEPVQPVRAVRGDAHQDGRPGRSLGQQGSTRESVGPAA